MVHRGCFAKDALVKGESEKWKQAVPMMHDRLIRGIIPC